METLAHKSARSVALRTWIAVFVGLVCSSTAAASAPPSPRFLERGCKIEVTAGPEWERLWLDCGCGRYLLTQANSLVGHVKIEKPEDALALLRLFSGERACVLSPPAHWVEVREAEQDGWLALGTRRFRELCPAPEAAEITEPSFGQRVFRVRRCLLSLDDGGLYAVDEQVLEDGTVDIYQKVKKLPNAKVELGSCSLLE